MGSTNLPESIVSKYGRDVRKLAEHPVHVEVEARLHLLERVALRLGRHVGVDVERNAWLLVAEPIGDGYCKPISKVIANPSI